MTKATAIAHPIQGLIKYHGLKNTELRLPFHDSISVCTAPFETRTTLELRLDLNEDVFEVDGSPLEGRPYERAAQVLRYFRQISLREERVYMRSQNNFPSNIGLGASASGFAALTVAANAVYESHLSPHELTTIARIGAGSASRAVSGHYSRWYAADKSEDSYAEAVASAETLPMGMVIAVIPVFKETEDAHSEAVKSPFMPCRIAYVKSIVEEFQMALIQGDFSRVGWLAEQDSLSLHATTMTGPKGHLHWQPQSLAIFHKVRELRAAGLECYFSVDTGATVYVNCRMEDRPAVQEQIAALGVETVLAEVGGAARLVDEHLF